MQEERNRIYIEPDLSVATCPICGYDNEVGADVGEDVCEHFIDLDRDGFIFQSDKD